MPFKPIPISLSLTTPNSASQTLIGAAGNGGLQAGLDDYAIWNMTAKFISVPGGTLDFYLQTQDSFLSGSPGPWSDIAHFPQIAAGAGTVFSYRIGFARGFNSQGTATPIAINTVDGVPALTANSYLTWANGSNLRLVVVTGVGVATSALAVITGMASTEG